MKNLMLTLIAVMMVFCMSVPAFASGSAPLVDNLEFETTINTALYGAVSAEDPEGDIVSFELTTKPIKGEINLEADGSFVYTPREGKKGRDYFGYKATDSQNNVSQEGTVIIRISKQK